MASATPSAPAGGVRFMEGNMPLPLDPPMSDYEHARRMEKRAARIEDAQIIILRVIIAGLIIGLCLALAT